MAEDSPIDRPSDSPDAARPADKPPRLNAGNVPAPREGASAPADGPAPADAPLGGIEVFVTAPLPGGLYGDAPLSPPVDPDDCETFGGVRFCPRCGCCSVRRDPEDSSQWVCSGGCDASGRHEPLPTLLPPAVHPLARDTDWAPFACRVLSRTGDMVEIELVDFGVRAAVPADALRPAQHGRGPAAGPAPAAGPERCLLRVRAYRAMVSALARRTA